MAHIRCSFRAGKVDVQLKSQWSLGLEGLARGNGWRGIVLTLAIVMWVRGLLAPGIILMAAAGIWSFVAMAARNWTELCSRNRVLLLINRGRWEDALELAGPLRAGSKLWGQFLGFLMQKGSWGMAQQWLEELKAGEERDYLLAVTLLGQDKPAQALRLCPSRPQGQWQTLKAEGYFQQGEWKKVLAALRSAPAGSEQPEHAWLRGASYFYLEQYKLAVKLLRQVAEQGDADYGDASLLLDRALTRVK